MTPKPPRPSQPPQPPKRQPPLTPVQSDPPPWQRRTAAAQPIATPRQASASPKRQPVKKQIPPASRPPPQKAPVAQPPPQKPDFIPTDRAGAGQAAEAAKNWEEVLAAPPPLADTAAAPAKPAEKHPGLRAFINRHAILFTALAALALAGAVAFIFWPHPPAAGHAYYSTDDGQSYFTDDVDKPPFIHDGKPALQAVLYRCPASGKLFVGYLKRLTADSQKEISAALSANRSVLPGAVVYECKKPGDTAWVSMPSPGGSPQTMTAPGFDRAAYDRVMRVECPDDGATASPE